MNSPATGMLYPSGSIINQINRCFETPEYAAFQRHMSGAEILPQGSIETVMQTMLANLTEFSRGITTSTSAFPVRENLEAPASELTPLDTPMRNRLKRVPGSGTSSAWRQMLTYGGGFGFTTTVTTGASSATQTVGDTSGMRVGDVLYFATSAFTKVVSSITNSTTVVVTVSGSTTTGEVVINTSNPAGAGLTTASNTRAFFAETGAPATHITTYASKSATYKLMGTYYDISGLAMAAGATFQNQYDTEQRNAIRNLMLNEENAIINADSSITYGPWGDGTNALSFDGINSLITTANGTPTAQVQTAVGALTTAHIDAQLGRLFDQGASGIYMLMSRVEAASLAHLAEANGSIIRLNQDAGNVQMGKRVTGYFHPITGEMIDIVVSRFVRPGIIYFLSDMLPNGGNVIDIDVLPQVALPQLAPNTNIQGYTAQVLAPTTSAPQVYPGIVTVYEVVRLKSALHVAKSSGITAV